MRIIEREHIDCIKWDELVEQTIDSSLFSYSWYLDAVAENWCVLVNENYTTGIALPYSVRLGTITLYTPIFVRYLEILGDNPSRIDEEIVRSHFKYIHFSTKQNIFGTSSQEWVHQVITREDERKLGSQAKRSLKKAVKYELTVETHSATEEILKVIHTELNGKFDGLDDQSLPALNRLMENAEKLKKSLTFEVKNHGGIVCLKNENQLLYLKGAVNEQEKKNGGMYLALNTAIEFAHENKMNFDFGGSNVEGVRKFNLNLGGKDAVYYNYQSNNYPFWYQWLKKMKDTFKK